MAVLACFIVVPCFGIWYFGATAYLVFHDQLLASLISREADMQYSYEDRIAVLRAQLEEQTSRASVDHQTLTSTLRDLQLRGEKLEVHAAAIDALVRSAGTGLLAASTGDRVRTPDLDNPLSTIEPTRLPASAETYDAAPPASASRLDFGDGLGSSESKVGREKRVELLPDQQSARLGLTLANVDERQVAVLSRMRAPLLRAIDRIETALAESGLPSSRWRSGSRSGGVGGPFVPLPTEPSAMTFDDTVALLQDAVARRQKLDELVARVPLRQPIQGRLEVTSPFGARLDPFYGRAAMHTGMDLMGAYGGVVRATAGGTVTVAGTEGGYGEMVEIDHGDGLATRYAHLSSIDVRVGAHVTSGAILGRIGSSGRATGPHLHYETRIDGAPVDPARFLKAGAGLTAG